MNYLWMFEKMMVTLLLKIVLQQFKRPWEAGRFLPPLGAGPVLHHLTILQQREQREMKAIGKATEAAREAYEGLLN